MAYTIVKSDGTVLTTIADGTINTSSTSLGLPGRNYAGYGQSLDTNFVHVTENFADSTPPANPLRGQIWYDTSSTTLKVCPTDGESNALAWLSLTSTASGGNTTFGSVNITGNATANNFTATNDVTANAITAGYLTISANATIADASVTTANIGTLQTTAITTGSATTAGTLTGVWTVTGNTGANASALIFDTGGISINNSGNLYGIRTDKYMYANGDPISFAGTYSNSNVAAYLPTYNGNILTNQTQASILTTGANTTAGSITGNWTLTTGSRLESTYADLAEYYKGEEAYEVGTVVCFGGSEEVHVSSEKCSRRVAGIVSTNPAYIMNQGCSGIPVAVALQGRVPCKVTGKCEKGDIMVHDGQGGATAWYHVATIMHPGVVLGKAIQDKSESELSIIEIAVGRL